MNNLRTFKAVLFTFLLVGLATALTAQKKEADRFFEQKEYGKALKMYNLYEKIDKREKALVNRAICHYYENNTQKCILDLSKAHKLGYNGIDFYNYMSKALHDSENYANAAVFYKRYLNKLEKNDPKRLGIIHAIKQCGFARNAKYKSQLGYVENLGTFVNSKGDETSPIESPNYPSKFYYTSERKTYSEDPSRNNASSDLSSKDIYGSTLVNGVWSDVSGIGTDINSSSNEIILDFSSNGSVLYFMSDMSESRMSILVDTFSENSAPNKFVSPISPARGDRDVIVFADSIFIFASNGRGGFGGFDLFMTRLDKNFYWSEPINLGSQINSSSNERSPYISRSGIRMFFSSDRKESFGGYDIFRTEFNKSTQSWKAPENLGAPINSPRNDIDFRLNNSGRSGFLSSDRGAGEGGYDIYEAFFTLSDQSQLKINAELSFFQYYMNIVEYERERNSGIPNSFSNDKEYVNSDKTTEIPTESSIEPVIENSAVDKSLFVVNPIYYDDNDDVRSKASTETIKEISRAYRQDPTMKIVLVSHSLAENFPEFDLFLSGKRGEKVIKEFGENGIPEKAIVLLGVGSNYPLMKDRTEGQRLKLSSTINRRIDIIPIISANSPVDIDVTEPKVEIGLRDFKYDAFSKLASGLSYRISIKEDSKMIDTGFISPLEDLVLEKRGKNYLYTLGMFKTFDEAARLFAKLKNKGISDIKIIPFVDLIVLEKGTLGKHFRKYPDLLNYIKFKQ